MKLLWAVLAAAAAVVLVIALMLIVARVKRRRRALAAGHAGTDHREIVVAVAALAVAVFFGMLALPDAAPLATITPDPGSSRSATPSRPPELTGEPDVATESAPTDAASNDWVKILKLTTRGDQVDVTVRVGAPPSAGTRYLLVAQFRGEFQQKGKVSSSVGTHILRVDLRLADPGSWRDFFVVGVGADAAREWAATVNGTTLTAVPTGTRTLTPWRPHRMPS